ncbi:MAG: fumarate hydratase [Candidatus Hadarchaeales archaeon]
MRLHRQIAEMIRLAETQLPSDVVTALRKARRRERNRIARVQLDCMLKNLSLASRRGVPICQDTGILTFFVRAPRWNGLEEEIEKGFRLASERVPLRPNTLQPLTGEERSWYDIHFERGRELEIDLLVKGGGAENWSRLYLLKPGDREGIVRSVLELLREAGGKPCPPVIVGVGIGGTAEKACLLAEKALLRPLGSEGELAELEEEIAGRANQLKIGPMGWGGETTVLGVRALQAPCHRATLPLAVSLQCWVARRASLRVKGGRIRVFQ